MPNYEIVILVNPTLEEKEARNAISNLTSLFDKEKDFKEQLTVNDELAYSIQKHNTAYRFIFNFTTEDKTLIREFNRLVVINKFVLRHLIINAERTYGYRAKNNPKKIKISQLKQEKYQAYLEKKEIQNAS